MSKSSFVRWPKRDPIKNCFLLPNEIFQMDLSAGAKVVYAYLLYIEDRATYQCHPSYKRIGRAVGLSENTVRKYVRELEEKQLINTEPTKIPGADGRMRNGSLLYTILPVQLSVDAYHQRQLRQLELTTERRRIQVQQEEYDRRHPRVPVCAAECSSADHDPSQKETTPCEGV